MGDARRRVVVTGLGLTSPLGNDTQAAFADLMAGRSAITLNAVGDEPHSATIASAVCASVDAAPLLGRGRAATLDRVSQMVVDRKSVV